MSTTVLRTTLGLILFTTLSACGIKPILEQSSTYPAECTVPSDLQELPDTIDVALTDSGIFTDTARDSWSDHHLLFANLYETLVTVDCLGGLHPGLARSWSSHSGDRVWKFDLRREGRFWDGSEVGTVDVRSSLAGSGLGNSLFDSVMVSGTWQITVFASKPMPGILTVLATQTFAITRARSEPESAQGSGPFRLTTSESSPSGASTYTLKPTGDSSGSKPVVQFAELSGKDERDLLLGGVDLLITADPAVIDYARSSDEFGTFSLPWDRAYMMLSTTRVSDVGSSSASSVLPKKMLDEMARFAVRREARGHESSAWFDRRVECPVGPSVVDYTYDSTSERRRILYDDTDPVARQIAERVVALGNRSPVYSADAKALEAAIPGITGSPGELRAIGASREEMEESLSRGSDFAYIVAESLRSNDNCASAEDLLRRVPWLSRPGDGPHPGIIPLVDTRHNLIVRNGNVPVTIDWFGNIRIDIGSTEKER